MKANNVLILPGWQNSGEAHWQTQWEARHGYRRVEQHDWMQPLRGDWVARLEDVVLACDEQPVLVAHSLGCLLVAAWGAHSRHADRVKAALLVAPGDAEREEFPALHSWRPITRERLPFPAVLLGSHNDPYCSIDRARSFAQDWGAQFMDYGNAGHINADSGLGSWPEGHVLLMDLMNR